MPLSWRDNLHQTANIQNQPTPFTLSTKAKESLKTALAFAIVYGIALASGWLNPYWAGFAVAMVSLAPTGQTLKKGILRVMGTVPGCIAAVFIIAIAPQERWLFLALICTWLFFTTYMMIRDKDHAYFWNVAGFVCLVIVVTAASGDNNSFFQHAVMRTVETAMGVIVYTLISIFIWPQKNTGAIKKSYLEVTKNQQAILINFQQLMQGKPLETSFTKLNNQQIALLNSFSQAIEVETTESITLFNNRHLLKELNTLVSIQMQLSQKCYLNLTSLKHIDFNCVLPNLNAYFAQQVCLFDEIEQTMQGKSNNIGLNPTQLISAPAETLKHSHYDNAAILLTIKELENLEENIKSTLVCLRALTEVGPISAVSFHASESLKQRFSSFITPDWATIRGAAFPPLVASVGFLIWVYINPPGHAAMLELPAIMAMAVASTQQMKMTSLLKPLVIAFTLCLSVYIFILPKLSLYAELATVLFICVFIVSYFSTGLGKLAGMLGVINIISIKNQQTYDVAAMLNTTLFILLGVLLVYILSYTLQSSRPEKIFAHQVKRFFKQSQWLCSYSTMIPRSKKSLLCEWNIALHLNEVSTLPKNISTWGQSIDHNAFNENPTEQVQHLMIAIQALSYRIQQLHQCTPINTTQKDINNYLVTLKTMAIAPLKGWSQCPDAGNKQAMSEHLKEMEQQTDQLISKVGNTINAQDTESLLLIIASYRGILEASIYYLQVAQAIDWSHWQQERFS